MRLSGLVDSAFGPDSEVGGARGIGDCSGVLTKWLDVDGSCDYCDGTVEPSKRDTSRRGGGSSRHAHEDNLEPQNFEPGKCAHGGKHIGRSEHCIRYH